MGILILVLIGAIVILVRQQQKTSEDYSAFKTAMSNEFKQFKNSDGQTVSQVNAAKFATTEALNDAVKQLNSQGAHILSKVDNQTQGLILLSNQVGGIIKGKTSVVRIDTVKADTVKGKNGKDSVEKITTTWPVYGIDTTNHFFSLKGNVGKYGFKITPLFIDTIEIKPTMLKQGLFKPRILGAQEINHNPYSTTKGFKYFQLQKTSAPIWKIAGIIAIFGAGLYAGHKL